MFLNSLYDQVLITPCRGGADNLVAVSGYASATFANRHLSELSGFSLNLIVGMRGDRGDHAGWLALAKRYEERLTVHYLESSPFAHCKAFGWFKNGHSQQGFTGSANYTQQGFLSGGQMNQMVSDDPMSIKHLYDSLIPRAINIHDFEAGDPDALLNLSSFSVDGSTLPGGVEWLIPGVAVKVSFLQRNGTLPAISGLNWGQRKGRNPNQAYFSIKKDVRDEGFLPERGQSFTLVTDDNKAFDCVVAQDGRKAIHSTEDNSILGGYIRARLGIRSGAFLKEQDLIKYGRTDFTLIKIDDETVRFDFSVPEKG